jgi:hypothetical protein
MLEFQHSTYKGNKSEAVFKNWLERAGITYEDHSKRYLKYDFIVHLGNQSKKVDVKTQSKPGVLAVEELHNCSDIYGALKPGWWYTSTADIFVFVGECMLWLPVAAARKAYELIKEDYALRRNAPTLGVRGDRWQSAFRYIPETEFPGIVRKWL